ncbi:xaa-Pro aminopeptidase 3 isoform X2 [Neoarius graeffei]|uniref:xaa-Pro aminopeptidase 3 isoform X2 n=1 Tax=Neoarius graeffei TaxID=443677 RepID=UPI00298CFB3E|nr:xaa-Pro aminopeptidase 3 isoform X2 [Neoarius graeffei]
MLQLPAPLLRAALHTHLRSGVLKCVCRSVWAKTGGWKTKEVPQRCLGQPSPYTHPHLIKHGEVTPGVTQTEYELRRQSLASLIESRVPDSSHVLVVLSHPVRYMTNDIPYPFHQNQDFLYLTGVLEPDCALVMYGSPRPDRPLLFVPPRNPSQELWDGPRSGRDGAAALTGIQSVHSIEELGSILNAVKGAVVWYDGSQPVHPRLHQTHVLPQLEGQVLVRPLRPLTHSLRAIKSPAEVELMKQAGLITAHAFRKTMAVCRGDIDEALIYAKFDFECRAHGANFLAYPPVVAGGNRANTLHYISNNQIVKTARRYCPHHVGHYLGMDVHDTPELSRSQPLQAGMAITIEPGLYFSEDDESCPQLFRGLGVRIEDDVVIREQGGPLILSAHTPKSVCDVERACAHSEG